MIAYGHYIKQQNTADGQVCGVLPFTKENRTISWIGLLYLFGLALSVKYLAFDTSPKGRGKIVIYKYLHMHSRLSLWESCRRATERVFRIHSACITDCTEEARDFFNDVSDECNDVVNYINKLAFAVAFGEVTEVTEDIIYTA